MRILWRTEVLKALGPTRLTSIFAVALVVALSFAPKQGKSAEPRPQNSAAVALPPIVNGLMVGCSQEGAIDFLLRRGGCRLELVAWAQAGPELCTKYDEVYILRVGNQHDDTWHTGKLCLYFRAGHLAYKCIVPNEEIDHQRVFREEIESGRQHPPNYPGLMDAIRWGKASEPQIVQFSEEMPGNAQDIISSDAVKQTKWPRVRCGIALGDLPEYGTEQRYNLLVIFQNAGPTILDESMILPGFGADPGVFVTAHYIDREEPNGFAGNFGICGSPLYRGGKAPKERPMRQVRFRLDPGEATYMWFHVADLQGAVSVQAHIEGLCGIDNGSEKQVRRNWDVESARIATSTPVRMCGLIPDN